MTTFRDRATGANPLTYTQVREREPDVGFPAVLGPEECDVLGVDPVEATDRPDHDPATHTVREGEPAFSGGVWRQTWAVEALPAPDMPALREAALAAAMAYGNAITGQITGGYAQAEVLSWDTQEREARMVAAGEALPPEAILPGLAEGAGRDLPEYAASVIAKADGFRRIAQAAVQLRRSAQAALLDEAFDTPAKLEAAVAQLRAEADALAARLIG